MPTQEEVDRFDYLMNSIDKINLYDRKIYDIAYETASAYFAGDKRLSSDLISLYCGSSTSRRKSHAASLC